ncbi:MAG: amidohydrolase [Myxococcota bacterium]
MRLWPGLRLLVCLGLAASCGHSGKPGPKSGHPSDPGAGGRSGPVLADLVLLGGTVHTLDPRHPDGTAVAIAGGRVLAVGTDDEIQAYVGPNTKLVGIEKKTVLPGLVDSHFHLFGQGEKGGIVDLSGTKSLKEIKEKVQTAARATSGASWIIGRGWDQNRWGGQKAFPTARDLDDVSAEHPVLLTRIDGHAVWANSAAMKLAGVGADFKDPPGGRILRGAGNKPTGVFVDNASSLVEAAVPPPTASDLRKQVFLGERDALKAGLTQIHEMGIGRAELDVLHELDRAGELKIRIYAMVDGAVEDFGAILGEGPEIPGKDQKSHLTVRGVKFYMDGALGSRGAALLAPYSDDPKNTGLILTDEALFEARVRTAKDRGYQVATHAIGDRANRIVLDTYERVFGREARKLRPRVEHAQVISTDDLGRFGQLGIVASMQPTHATSDGPWAEQRLGRERIHGAYAWRSLLATSATIAAGSDAPVESPDAIGGLVAAIFRVDPEDAKKAGKANVEKTSGGGLHVVDEDMMSSGAFHAEQRMTPAEAVHAFSRSGAWASFREEEAGLIRPGFVADLTVLDVDPMKADAATLARGHAELTIVDGVIAYARPGADRPPEPKPEPTPEPKPEPKPSRKAEPKLETQTGTVAKTKTSTKA